jgi:hypothetical protein
MKTVMSPIGLLLGPLLAATVRDNKAAIKGAQSGQCDPVDFLELTCTLAHAAAARVSPTVSREHIEGLVDTENMAAVFAACWGVTVPEPLPGESQAGSPST